MVCHETYKDEIIIGLSPDEISFRKMEKLLFKKINQIKKVKVGPS